jgi:putative redox protein
MSGKVTVNWAGRRRDGGQPITTFEVHSDSGHTVVVDEPPVFGDDLGMRPTEMLLGALGACTGVNAVLLLKKYKQPYRSLQVEVEGDQQEEWPKAFKDIRITFSIAWDGEYDESLVDEALNQACNQYCPVDATLTHGARIEVQRKDLA